MPHNHRQDLELLLDAQYKRRLDCMKLIAVTTSPTKKAEFELEKAKIEENIQQLEQQLEQLPPPPTATYFRYNYLNLTDTEGVLIGRQAALEELAELLAKGGCVAICAVGGQGKTALAYNYLKLHLKGPPRFEALLWLTIVGDGSDLTGLLALLGLNPAGQRPEEMAEAVRFYLADHLVLVVLDNFEAAIRQDGTLPLDIEALLRRIAEFRGQSHILITTREMPPPYRPQILPLTGLTPEAGADLLAERGLRKEPRSRLLKVATKAEGNPFALKILADLVTDPFMRDTLENLLRQGQLWDQELSERLLRKVWETRLSQEEHRLLQLLALLRPPVRRATLLALLTLASEASERQLEQGLRNLAHKSLVTLERDSPQMPIGYDLHPLLRRFVLNEKLSATECKALNQQAAAYFQTLLSSLPPSENYGRKSVHDVWPILEAIYHLNQLGDYQAATDLFFEEGLWEDLDRWGVATTLLELYREWAFPFTSYAWCNKRTLERILGNLGNAYADLGRVEEAIGYYEQALAISREIKDRLGEGTALGNLGLAYGDLGRVEEAIGYYEQALAISREIKDRLGEGRHLGNLGIAYRNLGRVEEAISYHEQALAISREIRDRRVEGNHLGNLGLAYGDLERVEEAISYHEQALAISREIKDRRGEGIHLGNLGNAYRNLGRVEEAISYHEQALTISREIGDRLGEGTALGNLGESYIALGKMEEALNYIQQSLMIAREIGHKTGIGHQFDNFGCAYEKLKNLPKALAYWRWAVVIFTEIKSPYVKKSQGHLDELRAKEGEEAFDRWWAESEAEYQAIGKV